MRAENVIRYFAFVMASLASAASVADSRSASHAVLAAAEAAPRTFSSTAVPQSLRSPNFNSRLEFSPQVDLGHRGPISLVGTAHGADRTASIPVAAASQRSLADSLLLALLGLTLIAYQLFRKHRLLRPQPFSF